MNDPKPCPFCGIQGAVWPVQENDGSAFWIECAICHARGPSSQLQDLALWEWNRRMSPIQAPTPAETPAPSTPHDTAPGS